MLLRLLGMMVTFADAPTVDAQTQAVLENYLGRRIVPASYRDSLTLERLSYPALVAEVASPRHGSSEFHLGHEDPTALPRHTPTNVSWRSARSNLIQGNLTLSQARTKFVELIARYFELGEVRIDPET